MKSKTLQLLTIVVFVGLAFFLTGCAKKKVVAKTPPPPPPPQPTATIAVNRPSVTKGESVELSWSTTNASTVTISGLGTVEASGSKTVTPEDSTTYTLIAKGDGGEANASARVTVNTPPPPVTKAPEPTLAELFAREVKDVYFDYDKFDLRPEDQTTAGADATFLTAHPDAKVVIEGHCDERGSIEYNLALGDSRAGATRDYLVKQGVNPNQLKTVSYGKERPFCTDHNEQCWQQNRRAHFTLADNTGSPTGK